MGTNWQRKLRNSTVLSESESELNEKHKSLLVLTKDGKEFEYDVVLTSYIHDLVKYNLVEKDYRHGDVISLKLTNRASYYCQNYISDNFEVDSEIKKRVCND